jgi:hypothetical protein
VMEKVHSPSPKTTLLCAGFDNMLRAMKITRRARLE